MKHCSLIIFFCLISGLTFSQESAHFGVAKFAPADGKKLLIIGQDLGAVGGLSGYTNGYIDNMNEVPAGVTSYTGIPNLGGLQQTANWGSGNTNAQLYVEDPNFDNTVICIGLYINSQLNNIISGARDNDIDELGRWIIASNRPIFLRIGYEFDGSWNGLDPDDYKEAWKYIVHRFDDLQVTNVAYVWQSAGINTSNIERWYPGDEYVNWVGYSHFTGDNPGQSIRDFTETHNKPIMIAEAAPRVDLKTIEGDFIWNYWYDPLFNKIDEHINIKALAYINADWESQSMWTGQGWGDSRVEVNDYVKTKWVQETSQDHWLKSSDDLLTGLQYELWRDSIITSVDHKKTVGHSVIQWEWAMNRLAVSHESGEQLQSIAIYDYVGKQVYFKKGPDNKFEIDFTGIQNSIYIIETRTRTKVYRERVLAGH